MKKYILLLIVTFVYIFAEVITILDNGIVRKIEINKNKYQARSIKNSLSQIIIKFTKDDIDIQKFIDKYSLVLKKQLKSGYYIFENNSTKDDSKLILEILKENKDKILTIRPNYAFGNIAR